MRPSRLRLAYFSPCGGNPAGRGAFCAGNLRGIPAERVDMTCPPSALPGTIPVGQEELLVLAFPVYGGVPPRIKGLFGQLRGQGGPCVLMAAYGTGPMKTRWRPPRPKWPAGLCVRGRDRMRDPHVFPPPWAPAADGGADLAAFRAFAGAVKRALAQPALCPAVLPGRRSPSASP